MAFPKDFVWGVAASSYQIEGAAFEDGRGLSVWDMYCRKPDKIWNGQSGETACDHYHRYGEDVDLMSDIGVRAYRLSISWPRVLPEGTGRVNEKGLDFYDRLVDALLDKGIAPYITLFHWDFPYALYCRGDLLNRDSADWFAEYTRVVVDRLSDRVAHWMTLNEPQCYVMFGHQDGIHAPGDKLDTPEVIRMLHHMLLAHGKSVQAIRANAKKTPMVGLASVGPVKIPATDSQEDIEAARHAMFSVPDSNLWHNPWWMDPVFEGRYPEDGIRIHSKSMPEIPDGDMETISQPLDFCGANIYFAKVVKAGADGKPEELPLPVGHTLTDFHWAVDPECLYWGPRFFYERYRKPILITENGMSNCDCISLDGKVHDPQRIDFLHRHLLQLEKAVRDGVDVRGYFQWSVMDNFEWGAGYQQRFGLVYVDYPTQRRILKDSANWYADVIRSNGGSLAL